MNKYIPPDFETIQKANAGDAAAMQKLLAHYNAYIMFFAKYNGVVNHKTGYSFFVVRDGQKWI